MKSQKLEIKKFFTEIKSVDCPAFPNEKISFNSKGVNHLLYKGPRKARSKREVVVRAKLLPRAVELLQKMPLPQEQDLYMANNKKFEFWAFEGVVQNKRIKVVIRQVGQGKKHFWSVIPSWRKTRFGKIKNSRKKLSKT